MGLKEVESEVEREEKGRERGKERKQTDTTEAGRDGQLAASDTFI